MNKGEDFSEIGRFHLLSSWKYGATIKRLSRVFDCDEQTIIEQLAIAKKEDERDPVIVRAELETARFNGDWPTARRLEQWFRQRD
jgi:hypothetical protein